MFYYLLYFLWLAVTGFGKLVTFQSVTTIPQADLAFSLATILSLLLIIVMVCKPRLWNIIPAFSINLAAITAVCILIATRQDTPQYGWGDLAAAGYFTALLQLLSLFIILLLAALIVFFCARSRRKTK